MGWDPSESGGISAAVPVLWSVGGHRMRPSFLLPTVNEAGAGIPARMQPLGPIERSVFLRSFEM